MLVLSRKPQETIVLDGGITITVVDVRGSQVRLGIEAPRSIVIQRGELLPERAPGLQGRVAGSSQVVGCGAAAG